MLNKIKSPVDVKKLSLSDLSELAIEVRKRIIEVTAKNGGHVAPSLGATDLVIALLKMFDPLEDRIVWDVGHQSYAYKILTERNDRFDSLRQLNGISGFNNVMESKYDAFSVGHSSTSISAALGIAVAKEKLQKKGRTIAIIGDGALTGGMSFEALNHSGHLQKDMIVILNDNNMSISKNVGALQSYLTNILVSRSYNRAKNLVWDFVQHFPGRIKRRAILSARKLEESLINTLAPNIIFEDLGFKYLGPIDGHDIPRLIRIFHKVKNNLNGPVFIHVVTKKGKGYEYAEENAPRFHGLGPYEVRTGKSVKIRQPSYSSVFGDTMCDLAKNNKKLIVITPAMKVGSGLTEFAEKFPEQFFDVGIAEQHAVTFAGGLAIQGLKPFVAIYSTFLQRAYDQLIHDVALQKLPVVFCLDRAGLVGEDGATHHGAFDLSYLNVVPNLMIMAPTNKKEFVEMLKFAENYQDGPIAIRYPRGNIDDSEMKIAKIEAGKFAIQKAGKNIAFIGIGKAFISAKFVYEKICAENSELKPYLINARFLKPFDSETLEKISQKVDKIFTFEENALTGGFGSVIKDKIAHRKIEVHSFGLPDKFVPHGKTNDLKKELGLTDEQILKQIKTMI